MPCLITDTPITCGIRSKGLEESTPLGARQQKPPTSILLQGRVSGRRKSPATRQNPVRFRGLLCGGRRIASASVTSSGRPRYLNDGLDDFRGAWVRNVERQLGIALVETDQGVVWLISVSRILYSNRRFASICEDSSSPSCWKRRPSRILSRRPRGGGPSSRSNIAAGAVIAIATTRTTTD